MAEVRSLTLPELREIVSDPSELAKGSRVFDEGGLTHLSRFEHKLFADAAGSGASPYKTQIHFDDKGLRGRCSCMAARSRPFCKHAAALLVAWARAPESFAQAASAPAPSGGSDTRRTDVKKGKVDPKAFMARGVEQTATLIRELAVSGVAALASDRVEQVRALGEALREVRLIRMSARTLDLSRHLARAATRSEAFEAGEYAELLSDMLLTVRKLEKHLAGEPLQDQYVEELIGKTWTKKDRKPVAALDLVEYAFLARTTPDGFVIRESRFIDVAGAEHYSEKQILPGFLAKRSEPKKSYAGRILRGTSGSLYPTFAPRRVDIDQVTATEPLGQTALQALLERALPSVTAAISALQERRKDVFAPDALPVAIRVDSVFADGARLRVIDPSGAALFLPDDDAVEAALGHAVRGASLQALLGDVALDGALPTLFPLAAVVRTGDRLVLVPLGAHDATAVLAGKRIRKDADLAVKAPTSRWVDVARSVGASGAAIALGEVRDEMAQALATGLPAVNARFAEPLVSRLKDLGLARQGDLLAATASKPDPADKLDDFVKLHQVLGIALARLAGASHVDRASLQSVPTYESVFVRAPERSLDPGEVALLQGDGKISRYEAAVHIARHFDALDPKVVVTSIHPTWANGSAIPHVARAAMREPDAALATAALVLGFEANVPSLRLVDSKLARNMPRVAMLTAIAVCAAVANARARTLLDLTARRTENDPTVAAHARRALAVLAGAIEPDATRKDLTDLVALALNASVKDDRIRGLVTLASKGFVEAIPAMRASFAGDVSAEVRAAAAMSLARIGDVELVETLVRMLRQRDADGGRAKLAAQALGLLGDARGIDELLAAYADGWQPGVVADAMRELGGVALEPLIAMIERRPEIADRKAALSVLGALPPEDVESLIARRLGASAAEPEFCQRAMLYLTVAGAHPPVAKSVAARIVAMRPAILDKKTRTSEEKALANKCAKYVD